MKLSGSGQSIFSRHSSGGRHRTYSVAYSVCLLIFISTVVHAQTVETKSGLQIMEEVNARHQQFPYVYEEQSMVMVDRNGNRDTRKLRRYSRAEEDGSIKLMLLFESPREVNGVALLATRDPSGETTKFIYLPAYGEKLIQSSGTGSDSNFLGTDFSIENLTGEILSDYRYIRHQDISIEDKHYFVVNVYPRDIDNPNATRLRRHFIRQDNYFITRTEHYDRQGRLRKLQSQHDLKPVDGVMWRASMILMEDYKEQHQSLIKIDRRVYSRDYVPSEIFNADWLFRNYPQPNQVAVADLDDSVETDDLDMDETDVPVIEDTTESPITP